MNANYGIMCTGASQTSEIGWRIGYYQNVSNTAYPNLQISSGSAVITSALNVTNFKNMLLSNTPTVLTMKCDPGNATASNRLSLYIAGGAAVTGNISTGSVSTSNSYSDLIVGCGFFNGGPITFNPGDFYEILIYNGLLSDTNRAAVASYLTSKWGVF